MNKPHPFALKYFVFKLPPSASHCWIGCLAIAVMVLGLVPRAMAATRTVELGTVQAEYSDQAGESCIENPRLKITREGQVAFDDVLVGDGVCRQDEEVFAIQDLDNDGEPEVIIDFFSGGAHCCSSSFILRYDARDGQYTAIQHLWGEGAGARRREDLDGDSSLELIHYDSRFAYAFGSFADSGLPIRIWQYRDGEMINVTRNYPKQVYDDAYKWWQRYTEANRQGANVKGVLAAYLADKYLLNEAADGWKRLEQIYKADDREEFFTKLREFLVENGYTPQATQARRNPLLRRPTDPPVQPPIAPNSESANLIVILEEQTTLTDEDAVLQIDQTLYDEYTFQGKAGQLILITLESTDFDPYLILVDPNQTIIAENDDVTTGSHNSQIKITLPQDGTYTVVANAYQKEGRGEYTLSVKSDEVSGNTAINSSEDTSEETASEETAEVSEFGTIEGTLTYPADPLPGLTVCAQSTQNYYLLNCIEAAAEQRTFRMTIRPGEYYIFSYRAGGQEGATGSVQDVPIYYTRSETSNDPLPVRVVAGKTISNISPKNARVCGTRTPEPAYCIEPDR